MKEMTPFSMKPFEYPFIHFQYLSFLLHILSSHQKNQWKYNLHTKRFQFPSKFLILFTISPRTHLTALFLPMWIEVTPTRKQPPFTTAINRGLELNLIKDPKEKILVKILQCNHDYIEWLKIKSRGTSIPQLPSMDTLESYFCPMQVLKSFGTFTQAW